MGTDISKFIFRTFVRTNLA